MTKIYPAYTITNKTLALLPAKTIEFSTIVLERERQYFIRQTPPEIIKSSCKDYWSSYEGRLQAVFKHTTYGQKPPIPIDPENQIIAIPTHSPKHHDCHWIIYNPQLRIIPHPEKTILHIGQQQSITLDISTHTLQKQIERAFVIYYK